ncbi:heavy-metal-associated domain-containing protein [Ralstonia sp. TCR112]|uniref:heavy-metal-associated domain-containing protein n=1 Tax=Ralstonia sp. TCR112 TaxID=2601730 RepID=UPI0011BF7FAD|nr:heavy-metal-associated domain-containing protein [Ralstonia sp. TCR112]TXD62228.1 heavy-metal-associated domain-containing protein [Ralstonia sp. TCR112]
MTTSSTTFSVTGMSCGHCVSAVTRAVQQVDAGANVQVDLDKQTVAVTSGAGADAVKAAIEQAGYPVKASA